MNETDYARKFMKAWEKAEPTLWWHKVADPTVGGDVTRARAIDVIACLDGKFVGVEWKLRRGDGRFPIGAVKYSQVLALLGIHNAGGCALVAIGRHKRRDDRLVYLIPIKEWVKRCWILRGPGDTAPPAKSISLHDTFAEFEFRPWDFSWLGYIIRNQYPIADMRAPTPERMKKLYGTRKEK